MNLNAELFCQLSYIAGNEHAMKKAVRYLKKLVSQVQASATVEEKEACKPRTKEEMLAGFDQACKELKLNLEGKLELKLAEELLNEL